jgi:hypothetical protein
MTSLVQDFPYALRLLMKNPGFRVVAVAVVLTMVAGCVDAPDVEGVVSGHPLVALR